ncbi:MAG: DoxX family protein [Chitinophagales bacterium]|nr:DoxX family protein [Chitinophagales bacterium]
MKNRFDIPQLFLRIALGIGFLIPVMDRLGVLGEDGTNGNSWGNWKNFANYTMILTPYLTPELSNMMAVFATILETVFGICLILGIKTRWMAAGSFALTLIFGISMFAFTGIRSPFNYSVFVFSGAALLLSTLPDYRWSLKK